MISHINALLVEGDETGIAAMKTALSSHDRFTTSIIVAKTLAQAKEALDENEGIDIIVTDLKLPDSEGVEVVRSLYESTSKISCPIIVVTADDSLTILEDCIKAGAYTFLSKGSLNGNLEVAMATAKARKEVVESNNIRLLETVKNCFTL